MKLKKILLQGKLRKELGINQIYYLKFDKPIFLEDTEEESLNLLRELLNQGDFEGNKKEFKVFWDIIHKNYLKQKRITKIIREKKSWYYKKLAIESRKNKIKKLKEQIKKLENE